MVSEHQARGVSQPQRRSTRGDPTRVDALLRAGLSPAQVAERLSLQTSYVLERAKMVRLDATGQSSDATTSQFARHDEHVAAVIVQGGYPACVKGGPLVDCNGRPWLGYSAAA